MDPCGDATRSLGGHQLGQVLAQGGGATRLDDDDRPVGAVVQCAGGVGELLLRGVELAGGDPRQSAARVCGAAHHLLIRQALRDLIDEVLRVDDAGSPIAALISGLDVAYDLGEGHPLLGRRMPDLDVIAEEKRVRVFGLAHFCCNSTVHQSIPGIVLNASTSCGRVTTPLGDCRCSVRGTRRRLCSCARTGTWHGWGARRTVSTPRSRSGAALRPAEQEPLREQVILELRG